MHILTLTSLFSNSLQPVHGVFVRHRMESFVRRHGLEWTVVAPVPYYPRGLFAFRPVYRLYARVPALESPWGYPLHHPRYPVIPRLGMRFYGRWMAESVRRTVLEIHRWKPVDLIDGHYVYPDGTAAVRMARELGVPVLLSARGTDLNLYPRFPAIRRRIQENLAACDHLICVCSELRAVAVELGMPPERTSVIGNGVDTGLFRRRDRLESRRRLGLPPSGRMLLSVGHLTSRKGFDLVLEAFAGLGDPSLFLAIAGDGEERGALARLAERLGVAERTFFPGQVLQPDLPDWYSAADLFVLASSREGWPNVLCEAKAMGLPVVATRVWGVPEVVDRSCLGILVDERTPEALRGALEQALWKPWDREHIEAVGRECTWDNVADRLLPIFREALNGRARSLGSTA